MGSNFGCLSNRMVCVWSNGHHQNNLNLGKDEMNFFLLDFWSSFIPFVSRQSVETAVKTVWENGFLTEKYPSRLAISSHICLGSFSIIDSSFTFWFEIPKTVEFEILAT